MTSPRTPAQASFEEHVAIVDAPPRCARCGAADAAALHSVERNLRSIRGGRWRWC
jgi:hypothetical protein